MHHLQQPTRLAAPPGWETGLGDLRAGGSTALGDSGGGGHEIRGEVEGGGVG